MGVKIPILLTLCCILLLQLVSGQLQVGFYRATCPQAETIVRQVVETRFRVDPSITPALLRMHFHDCFVRGCDASILIDSTNGVTAEKEAGPNQSVRGFDLIDEIKTRLEAACPQKVSCADIITLATRDSVALAGGPSYSVPTGRRDGLVSDASRVNLPGPSLSVSQALTFFTAKKLTLQDMVTLLGAHTVGVTHCSFVQDRLSNFQGTGKPDPAMDPALVASLSRTCRAAGDPPVFLDQNTSFAFDNSFFGQVMKNRGVLLIDQELKSDGSSAPIVQRFASDEKAFGEEFGAAMIKMGSIEVLVGTAGEIRQKCRAFNPKQRRPPSPSPPRNRGKGKKKPPRGRGGGQGHGRASQSP